MLDSKKRFLTALARQKPDRAPFNFWMDRRLMAQYEKRLGHRHWRVTHYGADVIETFTGLDFPSGPAIERDGTSWQTGPCFDSWSDVDGLRLPDPNADKVYSLIKADLTEFPRTAVILDFGTCWGVVANMRTYELIYTDMYDHAEEVHKLCRRITDIQKVVVERACKMGITALYLMEDLATSKGLALSPEMIEEFCLGYARELAAIAHEHHVPVLFHSDGQVMELTKLLLGLGISAVNPLQPTLNDAAEFKKRYGKTLAVYGALDNCFIIPRGTDADVRSHVLDVFGKLGRDGGLIFSTHDIPLETPPENVETMVRTIREECVYR
jgi:uroporphyrinogen-III decarboxylase